MGTRTLRGEPGVVTRDHGHRCFGELDVREHLEAVGVGRVEAPIPFPHVQLHDGRVQCRNLLQLSERWPNSARRRDRTWPRD